MRAGVALGRGALRRKFRIGRRFPPSAPPGCPAVSATAARVRPRVAGRLAGSAGTVGFPAGVAAVALRAVRRGAFRRARGGLSSDPVTATARAAASRRFATPAPRRGTAAAAATRTSARITPCSTSAAPLSDRRNGSVRSIRPARSPAAQDVPARGGPPRAGMIFRPVAAFRCVAPTRAGPNSPARSRALRPICLSSSACRCCRDRRFRWCPRRWCRRPWCPPRSCCRCCRCYCCCRCCRCC